ncbi:uncharacterized protein SAPINGB_P002156 [Magnusiomyces paraingens]|uniref:AMP-dependent synthetase/ligase domain-containing protein n=1 Tax=Magnusiomyces paraingens TaxID=2606893 RepID=A0A5E8BI43_9ASCO|nr:uncharacterized protein SAPINGB_P002156 [Saprochaete ingens]VVT49207.1 unnamed protein product [Saprochaete ingens]
MVLPGSTFPEHVQKRIPVYPPVWDKKINPNSSDKGLIVRIETIRAKPGKKQAIPIPGSEKPGFSAVYRNAHSPDRLISVVHPDLDTVDSTFQAVVNAKPNALCLGERTHDQSSKTWGPYIFQTYSEINERVNHVASGIINIVEKHSGLEPHKEQYTVGLYGPNSRNWVITDLACSRTALTPVPLYDTLGPEASKYIVNLTNMPIIFASIAHIPALLASKNELPTLKAIVSFNDLEDPEYWEHPGHSKRDVLNAWAKSVGVSLYSFTDVEDSGKHIPREHRKPKSNDVFTINFTSGTTGNPKGVILHHSTMAAAVTMFKYNDFFSDDETVTFMSNLPLAHVFDRVNVHGMLSSGARLGFLHSDASQLFDDLRTLKPTAMVGVPRIFNKMCVGIRTSTIEAPGKIGEVTRAAYAEKLKNLKTTGQVTHPELDKVWSDKVRKLLGFDNTRKVFSGSAPLAAENIDFIKCALSVQFCEGYGLTETAAGISILAVDDNQSGSVGPPTPACEVCLRDLPELGYSIHDQPHPRGEIMLRGPQMFHGYYKNEEETVKAVTEDGWFHTGDVGKIDDMGRIYIIDRVKNMFKLAQGEYVAPERIETIYSSRSSLISQVFVDGNSFETYLVGIVGITPEPYAALLQSKLGLNVNPKDLEAVQATFSNKDVRKAVLTEINSHVQSAGLKGFEVIKNIKLFIEPLSADNGTLTPTMKIKRPDCRRIFNPETSEMYEEGPLVEFSSKKKAKI